MTDDILSDGWKAPAPQNRATVTLFLEQPPANADAVQVLDNEMIYCWTDTAGSFSFASSSLAVKWALELLRVAIPCLTLDELAETIPGITDVADRASAAVAEVTAFAEMHLRALEAEEVQS